MKKEGSMNPLLLYICDIKIIIINMKSLSNFLVYICEKEDERNDYWSS